MNKIYCYGSSNKDIQELIEWTFKENGAIDAENACFDDEDCIYYIDNMGVINMIDESIVSEESFISNGYMKLEFGYVPKDKELVWCHNSKSNYNFSRTLKFYDAKNRRTFNAINGGRTGVRFDRYEPYEGEWPGWAKEALKHLED